MKLCECGCGKPTPRSNRTSARDGVKAGVQLRFIKGHNGRRKWPKRKPPVTHPIEFVPADVEDADYADGPAFAAWLADHGLMMDSREFRAWRNGERRPSFYTVDRILTRAGFLAIDLPDEVWLKRKRVDAKSRISDQNPAVSTDFSCIT